MNIESNNNRLNIIDNGTIDVNKDIITHSLCRIKNIKLKNHQLKSLNYMKQIENQNIESIESDVNISTNIGIYSDCVGAGKSITLLSLIDINNQIINTDIHEVYGCNNIFLKRKNTSISNKTTLIVVPHSICKQWEEYIIEYTDFTYCKINTKKLFMSFEMTEYDIILITSTFYNTFINKYNNNIIWNRVIFDEADTINIPSCVKPICNFTWFVTSTLHNLLFIHGYYYTLNHINQDRSRRRIGIRHYVNGIKKHGYIKDVFRHLDENADNILKHIIVKNKDSYVKESFHLEEPVKRMVLCKSPLYVNIVSNIVNRDVLRRLNAGDKDGAIELLSDNCNVNTIANIVSHVTSEINIKIGNLQQELHFLTSLEFSRNDEMEQNKKKISNVELELEKQNNKLSSIKHKLEEYKSECCPICIDDFKDPLVCLSCCNNLYCMKCITQAIQTNPVCPLCRSNITTDHFNVVSNKVITKEKDTKGHPTKENALIDIIRQSEKTLVFSSYDNTWNSLEHELKSNQIKYSKLSGHANSINYNINKFKNGELDVLLLNSNNYGSGLNLQNTTDIIFYHKMSSDLESQVIGRAQRYGRKSTLNVHFLCYENEVDSSL